MSKVATRAEVYKSLDSERDYQDARWHGSAPSTDPREHELDAWILYIYGYTQRLVDAGCSWDGLIPEEKTKVLDFVRKVGALCVVTMEYHGAPKRVMPPELLPVGDEFQP